MPGSGSPTIRRRELGALLRALRTQNGLTVEQVAEQLLVSPSKISRLETGQRGASARDIRDLADLYEVDEGLRRQLTDLAAEGKQQAWWQSRGLPYSTYVGLEAAAVSIQDFGLGLVPGLLQTPAYARAVLAASYPPLGVEVIEQRAAGRIERQQLLTSEQPPEFHAIIDEAVLHRVVGDRGIMREQLRRLVTVSKLRHVTVQVLPYEAGSLPVATNKFIILTFAEPIPGVVFIEGLTGDLYRDDPEDLINYGQAFAAMSAMAATPAQSRERIISIADALAN